MLYFYYKNVNIIKQLFDFFDFLIHNLWANPKIAMSENPVCGMHKEHQLASFRF